VNPQQTQKTFTAAFGAVLLVLAFAARAGAAVDVRSVDASGYPAINATVVTSTPTTRVPHLREDGMRVAGLEAANLGHAKSVVLAIDRSRSMRGKSLADASAAAASFVESKPQSDRISVVAFGSRSLTLTGFSTATIDADGALRSVVVDRRQGTALYDAVVSAANSLSVQPQGGRVIIVLTDGQDVSSAATLEQAVAAARSAGASVYPIAIKGRGYTPAPLRELAEQTGGHFFGAADSGALASVYSTIAAELARTWRLHYLTAARPGAPVSLHVTVPGQGAATTQFDLPSLFGAPAAPAPPSKLLPKVLYTSTAGTAFVALLVGAVALLALVLLVGARNASWVKNRVQPHIARPHELRQIQSTRERLGGLAALVRATERTLGHLRHWRSLHRLLERADLPLRTAEFVYIMLGCGMVVGFIAAVAAGSIAGLVGFVVGALIPYGFASLKAKRRLKAFENQLPDLLITLAASLKAGHSFRHGIQTIVEEGQAPASDEFRRVLTDAQLGRPIDDSLGEMATRVGSKNFSFVITAVTIQRQVGGSLATLFDMVAETVRQRQQFARKIRSLTAMGRLSAYVLVALPFFLGGVLSLINRAYMKPLFHDSAGHLMIIVAMIMMAVGSLILKKIVSFRG
jgi:tight adherence protein B